MTQDFLPPGPGRLPDLGLIFTSVRDLTNEDLLKLAHEGRQELVGVQPLQRIRASHHRAARLLAEGRSQKDVALIIGRTPQRIHQLTLDPAFKELIFYYETQCTEAELEDSQRVQAKLLDMGELALDSLHEELEENPRKMPIHERRQILQMALDRTVAPPKAAQPVVQTPAQITFNIAGPNIKPSTDSDSESKIIEHEEEK